MLINLSIYLSIYRRKSDFQNEKDRRIHSEIVNIFERLIHRLSHPSITAEKDLGWLLTETKKYILPHDASVEKGKRKHPVRVSARPEGLCAAVLWMRVRVLDLPMSMTEFSKRIGVSRPTIIGASKQLDGYETIQARRPGRPRKASPQSEPKPKRKLNKTRRELNKDIRKTVRKLKKERSARLRVKRERERLLDELDFQRADRDG